MRSLIQGFAMDERVATRSTIGERINGALRRFAQVPQAYVGALIVTFIVVVAIVAPWIAPYDPTTSDWTSIRQRPSWLHPFGTDELGRDILSRVIYGTRASLLAGTIPVALAVCVGVPLGLIAGYFGGWVDMIMSRITEALLACPFLVLAIALGAFLGPSLENAMLAIAISATPIFVRLARGQALSLKQEDYVDAARAIGATHWRILAFHLLPNCAPPLLVHATLTMAIAVLTEASLAFLGLGQLPPDPSWGSMLDSARQFLSDAPWMAVWPGLAIILAVVGFNLLGDGLRDVLEPRK